MDAGAPLVVGFDGSGSARSACAHARVLTARTGAETVLVHAGPRDEALRAALAAEAARFASPVRVREVDGPPADALCAEATRTHAGLVLVGSLGRGTLGRVLFGSVAAEVLRRREGPVLVAHEPVEAVRNVVAGVDETPDPRVVAAARAVVDATGADLAFVHAVDADPEMAAHPEAWGIADERWEAAVADVRARVFGPLRAPSPHAELLRFGTPPDVIRSAARELGAEIVVVGRRGITGRGPRHPWSVASSLAARGPFATLIA